MKYTFEIRNQAGERIIDLTDCLVNHKNIKITRNREDVIDISCDLDVLRKKVIDNNMNFWDTIGVNVNELRVYRGDKCISAGIISYVQSSMLTDAKTITITAFGWFYLLQFAYTGNNVSYLATDAGAIAWGLINTAQSRANGDYGITEGTIQASIDRDRNYDVRKNIYDAIIELSEVIKGFDFDVTWDKVFNVYYPKKGSRRNDLVFTYPGNIRSLDFLRDGMQMSNKVHIRGAGTGTEMFEHTENDTNMQEIYKIRESIKVEPDVSVSETLEEKGKAEIKSYKANLDHVDIEIDGSVNPVFGSYSVGDEIKLQTYYQEVFGPVNTWFRIDQIILKIDENNYEQINLKVMKL